MYAGWSCKTWRWRWPTRWTPSSCIRKQFGSLYLENWEHWLKVLKFIWTPLKIILSWKFIKKNSSKMQNTGRNNSEENCKSWHSWQCPNYQDRDGNWKPKSALNLLLARLTSCSGPRFPGLGIRKQTNKINENNLPPEFDGTFLLLWIFIFNKSRDRLYLYPLNSK